MQNKLNLKNKRVVVVGLARSGMSSSILLKKLGAEVFVSDAKDDIQTRKNKEKLSKLRIDVELGRHSEDLFKSADLIVVSPAVRFDTLCLNWARRTNIPVISEIELATRLCPASIIAVTGTNGKSTTVTLIGEILKYSGKKVHICGNIGKAFSGEIEKIRKNDLVCLEVSSFQLETAVNFKPRVCVILNFTRDHLDRYLDLNEYLEAKKRIFLNQDKNDFTVLNKDDPVVRALALDTKARVEFFNSALDINGLKLNANQAAAFKVGEIFGIKKEDRLKVLSNFKGLPHRMELADTIKGVDFIDDSKATTVASTHWALRNIYNPVILISGGRDKAQDFSAIKNLVRTKVKSMILIGEAKDKIKKCYKGVVPVLETDTLKKATAIAYDIACAGDCILLSPMCASFDMFKDYEERGNIFKKIIRELKISNDKIRTTR